MAKEFKVKIPEVFDLELSLDCGQAFRWSKDDEGYMQGVVADRFYRLKQENGILCCNCGAAEFDRVLRPYLDFDRDYKKLTDSFASDKYLSRAVQQYSGIRILRQQPWEALCSFIISQNNNIPRIKGIISRLCKSFGDCIDGENYTFPSFDRLCLLTPEELAPLRAGFRAKYIIDAAKKVNCGEVDFEKIEKNDIEFGRQELIKIKGVGKKVAECTLLYGFGKYEAFPVDVWVKRILAEMYPQGLPECIKGNEGIAQQYLFHYRRNSADFASEK